MNLGGGRIILFKVGRGLTVRIAASRRPDSSTEVACGPAFNKSNGKDNSAVQTGGVSYLLLTRVGNRIDSNRLRLRPAPSPQVGSSLWFCCGFN